MTLAENKALAFNIFKGAAEAVVVGVASPLGPPCPPVPPLQREEFRRNGLRALACAGISVLGILVSSLQRVERSPKVTD